jgi:hypothetical protein
MMRRASVSLLEHEFLLCRFEYSVKGSFNLLVDCVNTTLVERDTGLLFCLHNGLHLAQKRVKHACESVLKGAWHGHLNGS